MAKYRFEVVLEYPDDMHPEDILDLAQESITGEIQNMSLDDLEPVSSEIDMEGIMGRLKATLQRCGFENLGTIKGINYTRYFTHFLRGRECIIIEAVPEEEQDVIEAMTDGKADCNLKDGM
jgi:hypothetical protein